MRCKPNELAVISRTNRWTREFDGLLVETLRLAKVGDFGMGSVDSDYGPWWVISFCAGCRPRYVRHNERIPATLGIWPDEWLRPIRDDGSLFDETMFWVKTDARA